MTSLAQ